MKRNRVIAAAVILTSIPAFAGQGVPVGGGKQAAYRMWKSGVRAVNKNNKKTAEALWQRCLKADPKNEDCRAGLILLGHEALLLGPLQAPAAQKYEDLRRGARPKISGRTNKRTALKNWKNGARYFQQGDMRKARDAFTRCLEMDPSNEDCTAALERIDLRGGKRRRGGNSAAKLYGEGMRLFMKGRKSDARKSWKSCLKADPTYADCRKGLQRLNR